jgi:hypothetical protein
MRKPTSIKELQKKLKEGESKNEGIVSMEFKWLLSACTKNCYVTIDLNHFVSQNISKYGNILTKNIILENGKTYYSGERFTTAVIRESEYSVLKLTTKVFQPNTVVFSSDIGTVFGVCTRSFVFIDQGSELFRDFDVFPILSVMNGLLKAEDHKSFLVNNKNAQIARLLFNTKNI